MNEEPWPGAELRGDAFPQWTTPDDNGRERLPIIATRSAGSGSTSVPFAAQQSARIQSSVNTASVIMRGVSAGIGGGC